MVVKNTTYWRNSKEMEKTMTYANQTCEVCGGKDHIAGVASSATGPISICFCHICLKMGAEPKAFIDMIYDPEMGNFREMYGKDTWCYFDKPSIKKLEKESKLKENMFEEAMGELITEGLCYEPKPGHVKRV